MTFGSVGMLLVHTSASVQSYTYYSGGSMEISTHSPAAVGFVSGLWFFSWGGKTCCPVSLEITYFRLHVPVTLLWCCYPHVSRAVKFLNQDLKVGPTIKLVDLLFFVKSGPGLDPT